MKLTEANYYSTKANQAYFSVSQFKAFQKCPAAAMAELRGEFAPPKGRALLLGSYFDEMLTGTPNSQAKFIAENYTELFQKSSKILSALGKLKTDKERKDFISGLTNIFSFDNKPFADVVQANETLERFRQQPRMMHYISGKHQVIMTGEIEGVPFKIKMDSFDPNEFICDLKYMASLRSPNLFTPMIEYYGYDIQAAVYQEIVRQNIGKRLPFFFDVATKENPAHLALGEINQYNMDKALDVVRGNIRTYQKIKTDEEIALRCEDYMCNFCTFTKIITEPIDTDLFGMSASQIKGMNGNIY
jgi:hypothetical protein